MVWRAASDFSDLRMSAILQPLRPTGAQLFQAVTLRKGHQTRRSPFAPSLSTFHHALTVVVPMWITLVPRVWEASLDYVDGMTGISSYLPFVWSMLDLIVFCCGRAGFRHFKIGLLRRHVCLVSRRHSDTEKQTSKDSPRQ